MQSVINSVVYRHGVSQGQVTLDDISELVNQDDMFMWLGLHEPDEAMLRKIQEEFSLHDLAIEDAHAAHQRPKLEVYGETLFVVLRTAQLINHHIHFGETHLFVGKHFLVSVRHGPSLAYTSVREHCERQPERLASGPGFALYAIIDFVVDNYRPIIDVTQHRLEQLEDDIFNQRTGPKTLQELYDLRRELLKLRAAATPVIEICNELMRFNTHIVPKESRVYFRDVQDHVQRVVESADHMRELLNTAMNINLTLITVGQNEIVKRLAGWGAILALPTMLFSMYGMNFVHMPELRWPAAYPVTLTVVLVGCSWLYRRLKKANWL